MFAGTSHKQTTGFSVQFCAPRRRACHACTCVSFTAGIVIFAVGPCQLALPHVTVQEIVRAVEITGLPGAPPSVEGVIDVRGSLLPVYDLRVRLGIEPRAVLPSDVMLICNGGSRGTVVVRVDRVIAFRELEDGAIGTTEVAADPVIAGLLRLPDGVVLVCDLGAFLSSDQAISLAYALAGAAAR